MFAIGIEVLDVVLDIAIEDEERAHGFVQRP